MSKILNKLKEYDWVLSSIAVLFSIIGVIFGAVKNNFFEKRLYAIYSITNDNKQLYTAQIDDQTAKADVLIGDIRDVINLELPDSAFAKVAESVTNYTFDTFLANHEELYHSPNFITIYNPSKVIFKNVRVRIPFQKGSYYECQVSDEWDAAHKNSAIIREGLTYFKDGVFPIREIRPGETAMYAVYQPHTSNYTHNSYLLDRSNTPFLLVYEGGETQEVFEEVIIVVNSRFDRFITMTIAGSYPLQALVFIFTILGIYYVISKTYFWIKKKTIRSNEPPNSFIS